MRHVDDGLRDLLKRQTDHFVEQERYGDRHAGVEQELYDAELEGIAKGNPEVGQTEQALEVLQPHEDGILD